MDAFTQFVELGAKITALGVALWGWWQTRQDLLAQRAQNITLTDRLVELNVETTKTLTTMELRSRG